MTGRWGYKGFHTKETGDQFPPLAIYPFVMRRSAPRWQNIALSLLGAAILVLLVADFCASAI